MQTATLPTHATGAERWVQLVLGLVVMMAISSPQYVWTLFTKPLMGATGADLGAIQVTFSILVVLQTWAAPGQGWLIDRFGPKVLITLGAALTGLGWVLASRITSLYGLYATYGLFCGIGTGFVYVGVVGLMVRWFPDHRGMAVGVVAAGYGSGALITTFPIDTMINSLGFRTVLFDYGLIQGAVGVARRHLPARAHGGGRPLRRRAQERRVAGRDAAFADLLADVRDDDHDVDRRPDGGVELQGLRRRISASPRRVVLGVAAVPLALTIDRVLQRPHAPLLRLGVGPARPGGTRWRWRSRWKRCRHRPPSGVPRHDPLIVRPDVGRRVLRLG